MACLAPPFKCPPSALSYFRPCYHQALHGRCSYHSCFLRHCVVSAMTTVIEIDKLHSLPPETRPCSPEDSRSLYANSTGPPVKMKIETTMPMEILLTGEEAVIAAAAAEALALARSAFEAAKEVARIASNKLEVLSNKSVNSLVEVGIFCSEAYKLHELEHDPNGATFEPSSALKPNFSKHETVAPSKDVDLLEILNPATDFKALLHSEDTTVRSKRQIERKSRRTRASERVCCSTTSVKSGFSPRKKRSAMLEIDYSDPLRYLKGTTSTSKLLTSSDELELSEGIQDLLKLERLQEEVMQRNGGHVTFAQWAEAAGIDQRTLRSRLNYGTLCKDKMIKSNIRLVISIAKNYQGVGMNLQDLVQEGCRGLVKGAEKFDASKGFKFSTYAHWWIRQAVRKFLSDQSRTIRLPFHMVEATYRVREARKQLYGENGRHPNNKEVAEAAGLSMKRLTAVMLTPKAPRSLDQKIGANQNLKPSEIIADPDAETAECALVKQFMKEDLSKVLESLNPREEKVIRWRFGLEDGRMKTLQEIGELMGISRERVRQIESCAFRKLKNKRRTKQLQQYLVA